MYFDTICNQTIETNLKTNNMGFNRLKFSPKSLRNPDSFIAAWSMDSLYLAASEAIDCGDTDTTINLFLSTWPVYEFNETKFKYIVWKFDSLILNTRGREKNRMW